MQKKWNSSDIEIIVRLIDIETTLIENDKLNQIITHKEKKFNPFRDQ